MNLILIIRADKFEDIPDLLDETVKNIKQDMNIMGDKANSCAMTEEGHNYDYQIDVTNHKSLGQLFDHYHETN